MNTQRKPPISRTRASLFLSLTQTNLSCRRLMHLNTIRQYNTMASLKHPLEANDSWNAHIARQKQDDSSASSLRSSSDVAADASIGSTRRRLHHNHHGESSSETTNNNIKDVLENEAHQKDIQHTKLKLKSQLKSREKEERKRRKRYDEVYRNPGIGKESVHGLMVSCYGHVDKDGVLLGLHLKIYPVYCGLI